MLRGVERFRILEEDDAKSYRRAIVEPVPDPRAPGDDHAVAAAAADEARNAAGAGHRAVDRRRGRLESVGSGGRDPKIPSAMADEDLVNALAQYLDLEPLEKQALLEQQSLRRAPNRSSNCSR